ncbi:MAG TPA: YHS domain-containing protein [Thermodesulfobacteriota bacterium]
MATFRDPVCGVQVDDGSAEIESTYQGKTYVFCSEDCKRRFEEDPARYAVRP